MFYDRFSGRRKRKPGGVLNILLRACRCASVWTVRKRAGKVKIPAGWSEKYLWKDGILYRMTRKKIRKDSPRNGKNVRSGGKFIPKNEDFSFENIQEKHTKYGNEMKKFLSLAWKKQQIFSQADGKIQKCTGKEAEKFIESSEKSMKNIRPIGINSIIDGRSG